MNTMLLSLLLLGQFAPFDMSGHGRADPRQFDMSGGGLAVASMLDMSGGSVVVTKKRDMNFYGPSWCPNCPAALEAVKKALADEFEIKVHKDYDSYPAWVRSQGEKSGWGYPMVHWTDQTDVGKIMVWSGVAEFRKHDGKPKKLVSDAGAAPTPYAEVVRVLALLPTPVTGFVDFGCGADARWCVAAAERWGCRVTGVEIDPARAAVARERVRAAGLEHLITIVTGDVLTTEVQADVGVAYLYHETLDKLRPRLEKMRAFASYMHRPSGLPVVQNGDTWLYVRPVQGSTAVWGGVQYTGPVCNRPGCEMCNSIRGQLSGSQQRAAEVGIRLRSGSIWDILF